MAFIAKKPQETQCICHGSLWQLQLLMRLWDKTTAILRIFLTAGQFLNMKWNSSKTIVLDSEIWLLKAGLD